MIDRIDKVKVIGEEPASTAPELVELLVEYQGGCFLLQVATLKGILERIRENSKLPPDQRRRVNIMPMENVSDLDAVMVEVRGTSPSRLEKYWTEIPKEGT